MFVVDAEFIFLTSNFRFFCNKKVFGLTKSCLVTNVTTVATVTTVTSNTTVNNITTVT